MKNMYFGLVRTTSIEVETNTNIADAISDFLKDYLKGKDYGAGIEKMIIGIICIHPRFGNFHKIKTKYTKSKKILESAVKLDFEKVLASSQAEVFAMLEQSIIGIVSIIDELKIQKFDTEQFRKDLEMGLAEMRNITPLSVEKSDMGSLFTEECSNAQIIERALKEVIELSKKYGQHPPIVKEHQLLEEVVAPIVDVSKRTEMINKLVNLKNSNKFSEEQWVTRLAKPSSEEKCKMMDEIINKTIEELLVVLQSNYDPEKLKQTMSMSLVQQDNFEFDTEEIEFLCDVFVEVSKIVQVNISKELNKWLYGELAEEF